MEDLRETIRKSIAQAVETELVYVDTNDTFSDIRPVYRLNIEKATDNVMKILTEK